jgi:hypothetical protein
VIMPSLRRGTMQHWVCRLERHRTRTMEVWPGILTRRGNVQVLWPLRIWRSLDG